MRAILISNHGLCKSCPTITKIPLKFFRPSPHLEKLPLILPVSPPPQPKILWHTAPIIDDLLVQWQKHCLQTIVENIRNKNNDFECDFLFFCCISSIALLKSVVSNMTSLLGVHIDNICKANTVPRKEETNPEWIVCVFRLRIFFLYVLFVLFFILTFCCFRYIALM